VVTGLGLVTPIGIGVPSFWEGVMTGRQGVRPITRFDASALRTRIAGQVDDFDAQDHVGGRHRNRLDRFAHFSIAATRMALEDSGLTIGVNGTPSGVASDRAGSAIGSALGGMPGSEADHAEFLERGPRSIQPSLALRVYAGAGVCNVAI
jgi:3-oxoacyl-[acyl-carrier-protein] synthase II